MKFNLENPEEDEDNYNIIRTLLPILWGLNNMPFLNIKSELEKIFKTMKSNMCDKFPPFDKDG